MIDGRADTPITGSPDRDGAAGCSGATLKRTRELLRLSQARMARDMNLPIRWVQDLEQGRNGMTAPVRLLVKVMEMHPDAVRQAARLIRAEEDGTA